MCEDKFILIKTPETIIKHFLGCFAQMNLKTTNSLKNVFTLKTCRIHF